MEEGIARITADPGMVRPRRQAPLVVRTGSRLPLGRRLRSGEPELLRLLMQDPGDRELYARARPAAMWDAVMPILRRHGLIRDDRPLAGQACALHALLDGFSTAVYEPETAPPGADDPDAVLADTVAQLFEPADPPGEAAVKAAAEETLAIFREIRDAVLDLIDRSQTAAAP